MTNALALSNVSLLPPVKSYNREADGTTYFYDHNKYLLGTPTWSDGRFDISEATYISEYDEPLSAAEISEIMNILAD